MLLLEYALLVSTALSHSPTPKNPIHATHTHPITQPSHPIHPLSRTLSPPPPDFPPPPPIKTNPPHLLPCPPIKPPPSKNPIHANLIPPPPPLNHNPSRQLQILPLHSHPSPYPPLPTLFHVDYVNSCISDVYSPKRKRKYRGVESG